METLNPPVQSDDSQADQRLRQRAGLLFEEELDGNRRRTDRMFARLMIGQWLAGIAAAIWISPLAWEGQSSHIHYHVWASIFLGGIITSFPVFMARVAPGSALTRHAIAIGQMLTSGLLVHLTGGRIETHFHYFGSLAFLAFYRDWRVLLTATIVAGSDHLLRGIFWPESIFGVLAASPWRWLEHVGWVAFEDLFLLIAMRQNRQEMYAIAERQARLETVNEVVERKVAERTHELEVIHKQLVDASRRAGMAEIATNVLHNVGNVLNSVNVSATLISDSVKKSKVSSLTKVVAMLREHEKDLGVFITTDPKGRQLPAYLPQLSEHLLIEQEANLRESELLRKNIEHIKTIVSMQQNYARVSEASEPVDLRDLIEDSLRMNAGNLGHKGVDIARELADMPRMVAQKHKILQILVNLVRNGASACLESSQAVKRLTVRLEKRDAGVVISIIDNGIGIPPENLTRIFNQGFTTKKDGHGFGLHSAALAAREMGGTLTVRSDGPNTGATFVLDLPMEPA